MKLAVVGGGGFRTPHVWEAVVDSRIEVADLVLHDRSAARLGRMAAVLKGLRAERGYGPPVRATTDLADAVDGADVVFCAIRVGGLDGRVVDETVPLREGVLGQETVGPGGICYALRTVPVMLDIARVVAARAPGAWFLNFTNPAGLVTEAVRPVLGERAIGICDSPEALCARVAAALRRRRSELRFDYAGVNHLGWLLGVRDGERDLLPGLLADDAALARLDECALFGAARLRALGAIPNEYLVYYESPAAIVDAFRRAGATRAEVLRAQQSRFYDDPEDEPRAALASWRRARDARYGTYMAEAWETVPGSAHADPLDEGPGEAGYAAVAAAFVRAAAGAGRDRVVLDVANRGRVPFLDDDAVVEVPCEVGPEGAEPLGVGRLPPGQAELVARVKEVERITIAAATRRSRALALEALAAHPVVPSRPVARRILAGYLESSPGLAETLR
ncbi:MAG TPA: 6-phospho-beta-glucosidase [Actinomycetota bacterium]|nr:6-phospho-beta-glucosidase [Actinomycetota bacterium]